MNILVINSGSSSIKYQLFRMPSASPVCAGLVERIGQADAVITHKIFDGTEEIKTELVMPLSDHGQGLEQVVFLLTSDERKVIQDVSEIDIVGHRVVHGGELYSRATIIDNRVKENIKVLSALAPLHNPANLAGIEVAEKIFINARQIAVFDTAFHQSIPDYAFRYAIPENLYTEDKIRVYGFHGTSHQYVTQQAYEYLGKKETKFISIHLGNGCSMAAVQNGRCIDTSMGFSPLAGLVMGTRSGDIDPSVVFYLFDKGYSSEDISSLLNKQSGMAGLTGFNDMRDVNSALQNGNANAKIALDIYAYRIQKYIGAYVAAMNGLDAIIFTAGVGENDADMRKQVCTNMSFFGISIDEEKNKIRKTSVFDISDKNAGVKVLVIPTKEEWEIAKQCFELVSQ